MLRWFASGMMVETLTFHQGVQKKPHLLQFMIGAMIEHIGIPLQRRAVLEAEGPHGAIKVIQAGARQDGPTQPQPGHLLAAVDVINRELGVV